MGYYFGIFILALFAVLQNSILSEFRLLNGQPELVMLTILAWSWHASEPEAIFWAFMGGIMQDVLNPIIPIGLSTITFLTCIMVLKTIIKNFYEFSIFVLIAMISTATLMHHILIYLWLSLQNYPIDIANYFRNFTVPTLGLNLLIILPLYWLLRRIQNRISRQEVGWEITSR